VFPGPSL